jgi:DNA polymerase III alpha subunit
VGYLIQAGALDDFGGRPALLTLVDALLSVSTQVFSARDVGQFTLFGDSGPAAATIQLPTFCPPISNRKLLEWEKELLGTYLSDHPLMQQERELLAQELINTTIDGVATESLGQQLILLGMVQRVRRVTTKKGDTMAFVTLESPGGTLDVTVFPRTFERFKELLIPERTVVVSGKLDSRADREEHSLIADWFKEPHEMFQPESHVATPDQGSFVREQPAPYRTSSTLRLPVPADPSHPPHRRILPIRRALYVILQRTRQQEQDYQRLTTIHSLLTKEKGDDHFVLVLKNEDGGIARDAIELHFPNERTRITSDLRRRILEMVGSDNMRVVMGGA